MLKKILYYFLRYRKRYERRALYLHEIGRKDEENKGLKIKTKISDKTKEKYFDYMVEHINQLNKQGYTKCEFTIKDKREEGSLRVIYGRTFIDAFSIYPYDNKVELMILKEYGKNKFGDPMDFLYSFQNIFISNGYNFKITEDTSNFFKTREVKCIIQW